MTSKKNKARSAKEATRKFKKKANPLVAEKIEYIDYKDINLLQRFMSDRSKIRGRRLIGTGVQEQRELATAIKNAREMALLPYTKRTTSVRAPRPGREDREGGSESREDAPGTEFDIDTIETDELDDMVVEAAETTEA